MAHKLAASMGPSVLVAAVVSAVYLAWEPASADLAAQTFRADLFADQGFVLWSNAWYGGFHIPGYSLLYPPLASWLGIRVVGALAAIVAAALFAILVSRRFGEGARYASLLFALGVSAWLFTGRMPFLLGIAIGLGALLAADSRRLVLCGVLAGVTAVASPVAGLFVGLAGAALGLAGDRVRAAARAARGCGGRGLRERDAGPRAGDAQPVGGGVRRRAVPAGPRLDAAA